MDRRKLWWGSVAALTLALVFVAWATGFLLEREIAAARAEGVPLDASAVRRALPRVAPDENAAPLIRAAFAADRASRLQSETFDDVAKGRGSVMEKALARRLLRAHPDLIVRWRRAAERSGLDYDRAWERGWDLPFPEASAVRHGAFRLIAAAKLGLEPKANLIAAARLSSLMRSQPSTIEPLVGVAIGRAALRVAGGLGLAKAIETELGPPIDVRRTLLAQPSSSLVLLDDIRHGRIKGNGDWTRRLRFWNGNSPLRAIHGWRLLWSELPKDGRDYAKAAATLDHRMFGIDTALVDASNGGMSAGGEKDAGDAVRTFARFEAEREKIREGG